MLFATNLGVLVLDEPTDGLDEQGETAFGEALGQLQQVLKETKTQTIIATHAKALTASAEKVIDVKSLTGA